MTTYGQSPVPQPDLTAELYQNLPVYSHCIRLLRVYAREGSSADNTPLRCQLYVTDVNYAPSYTALSYVWGNYASPSDLIYGNDVPVAVTRNCYEALQHLRAINGSFTIWIDAICINQKDQDEKAQQISLMGDIYSQARTTYIWLGKASVVTNRVLGFLNRVGFLEHFYEDSDNRECVLERPRVWGALKSYMKGRWGFQRSTVPHQAEISTGGSRWSRFGRATAKPKDTECTGQELEDFLDCTWITRIWTYQEVILSANPVVVCGHAQISWSRLAHSVLFLTSIHLAPVLRPWVDIVFTRDLYRAGFKHTSEYDCRLLAYWNFCRSIYKSYGRCCILKYGLIVGVWGAYLIILPLILLSPDINVAKILKLLIPLYLYVIWINLLALAPNPDYAGAYAITGQMPATLADTERYVQGSLHDKVIDTLSTRDATEPRDMSFGLRAVLEQLCDYEHLPDLNQSVSLPHTYQQLTRYLLQEKTSLRVLILAAGASFKDAPSWVPDYSQRLVRFPHGRSRAAHDSKPYFKYHSGDVDILVVKGFIVGHITCVQPAESIDYLDSVKTTLGRGYCHSSKIGDKLALIAGVDVPLIVRGNGSFVRIVTSAYLSLRVMKGRTWKAYEKKRRREWMRKHVSQTDSQILYEPDPAEYLEDIFIS